MSLSLTFDLVASFSIGYKQRRFQNNSWRLFSWGGANIKGVRDRDMVCLMMGVTVGVGVGGLTLTLWLRLRVRVRVKVRVRLRHHIHIDSMMVVGTC